MKRENYPASESIQKIDSSNPFFLKTGINFQKMTPKNFKTKKISDIFTPLIIPTPSSLNKKVYVPNFSTQNPRSDDFFLVKMSQSKSIIQSDKFTLNSLFNQIYLRGFYLLVR